MYNTSRMGFKTGRQRTALYVYYQQAEDCTIQLDRVSLQSDRVSCQSFNTNLMCREQAYSVVMQTAAVQCQQSEFKYGHTE
jgi:hypothetical protein